MARRVWRNIEIEVIAFLEQRAANVSIVIKSQTKIKVCCVALSGRRSIMNESVGICTSVFFKEGAPNIPTQVESDALLASIFAGPTEQSLLADLCRLPVATFHPLFLPHSKMSLINQVNCCGPMGMMCIQRPHFIGRDAIHQRHNSGLECCHACPH
jgi:hypothetical protein